MRRLVTACLIAGLSVFATSAFALNTVTNLDNEPHRVVVRSIGGAERIIDLPVNGTERYNEYQSNVYLTGQEARIQPSRMGDQFVIWDDGILRLQRRQYQGFTQ
ncbi:MAG: hypothetical protein K2Q12_11590 [Rickettsiales bacterium]|nr:hypothetical protein [Rickettsiales bacterium]